MSQGLTKSEMSCKSTECFYLLLHIILKGNIKGKKIYHLKGNRKFVQHSSERNQRAHCNRLPNDSEIEPPVLWGINIISLATLDGI